MPQQTRRIVEERLDEPHVEGRRVTVLQLRDRVEVLGRDPAVVADEFDLDLADVYRALTYYHDHESEMEAVRAERDRALSDVRSEIAAERPDSVDTPS